MKVPADLADLTPEWMSQALGRDFPGAEVDTIAVLTRDDGTNRRARFGLTYRSGSGPAQVFLKAEGDHREVHARNGNLFNESELYAHRLPLHVDHPQPYHVVIDREGLDYLIVMEDVCARGADPRDSTRPMSTDQAADGVRGLARLHAAYQGRTDDVDWLQTWAPTEGWQAGLRPRIPVGIERAGMDLDAVEVLDRWVRFVTTLADGPQTLLHADAHIGNTYVLPGDEVGFLDWQVVRRGNHSQDVGYFLVGALVEDDRRACEQDLMAEYAGAAGLPFDDVWLRYRASHVYGLAIWLSTLGTEGYQRHEVSLALVERYAAAVADLDSDAALAQLER